MNVVVRSFPTVRNAFPTVGNAKIIHDGTEIIPDQIQSYLLHCSHSMAGEHAMHSGSLVRFGEFVFHYWGTTF